MGDHMDESLAGSLENLATFHDVSASSKQASSSNFGLETGLSSSSAESGDLSGSSNGNVEDTSAFKNSESQSQQVNISGSTMEAHAVNASVKEQTPTASASDDTAVAGVVGQDSGNLDSNGESISDANMDLSNTNSVIPASLSPQPCPEFLSSDREREARAARVLLVDVVNIHSNILSISFEEISNREARRNSRRMFWDAFSRSNLRRNRDSPTIVFTSSHADDLGSHDRWLLDFGGDLHLDGVGRESRYPGTRSHHRSERRWQSRVICLYISFLFKLFMGDIGNRPLKVFCLQKTHWII
jgi:E3 ubiquitin-protein ligase RLIM